jgi:uncharacterized RDD family membrane protein YckC
MKEGYLPKYQTFSQRLGAAIIDGIIFTPLLFLMPEKEDSSIFWIVFQNGLYLTYSIIGRNKYGQTIGKRVTLVKVVQNNDETKLISLEQSFRRDLISIVFVLTEIFVIAFRLTETGFGEIVLFFAPFIWFIAEIVTMLFNSKRRSVHDFIAGSVCIDISKKAEWEKNYGT